jgi:hypothetical protein
MAARLSAFVLLVCSVAAGGPPVTAYPQSSEPAAPQPVAATSKPTTQSQWRTVRGTPGYWRLAQGHDGVWWFVSPDNRPEFLNAVTTVQPYQLARDRNGPDFVSRDFNGLAGGEGDLDAWSVKTLQRVRQTGFKSLGAWCHPAFHKLDVPIVRDLNITTYMSSSGLRFYSPQWPELADRSVRVQVEPLRQNRNLIGYYTDNELDWSDEAIGPRAHFDNLTADDPSRAQVMIVVRKVWNTLESFNADWQTSLADWLEINTWKVLPRQPRASYDRLLSAWLSHLAEDYFRLTSGLVRKYDPNHLILGVRFRAFAPDEVVRASRHYTDAQSINIYPSDAKLDADVFSKLHQLSGQPVIVSEYSFHALDGRSGNRNTFGFGAQVLDQQARADAYKLFTTRLARVPYIVGGEWFQWMDEPPSGRSADGEDVNFGIVDIDDKPYELLEAAVRKTTPMLNRLHAASAADDQKEVWRQSFATRPVMSVPFLTRPPTMNGELSDWPAESRLQGMRHSQTVGLERSKHPLPNVHLGWTYEGLYIGVEMFDSDIQAAAPNGNWWTRDCVEMFISTRPVGSDQYGYNEHCHQFFFVPIDSPFADHFVGVVGQWRREGDALKDHRIPHPEVREATRILPNRYVVEIFYPAAALNGFDPKSQRAWAFNLVARNYQHATEYFWSAPKEVMTQLKPNTWGQLYLELPRTAAAQSNAAPATQPSAVAQ